MSSGNEASLGLHAADAESTGSQPPRLRFPTAKLRKSQESSSLGKTQYAIVVARALEKEPVKELDRSSNLLNSKIGSLVCSSIDIISRCASAQVAAEVCLLTSTKESWLWTSRSPLSLVESECRSPCGATLCEVCARELRRIPRTSKAPRP